MGIHAEVEVGEADKVAGSEGRMSPRQLLSLLLQPLNLRKIPIYPKQMPKAQ